MLKTLIATTTCIVVLLGVGYYVWRDTTDREDAARLAELRQHQAAERERCLSVLSAFNFYAGEEDRTYPDLTTCIADGYLSAADIEAERRRS